MNVQPRPMVVGRSWKGQRSPDNDSVFPSPRPSPLKSTNAQDQLMAALRQRIRALGLTLAEVDEKSGLPDGYVSKILNPQTSGRQAKWSTIQVLIDTLWPAGAELTVTGMPAPDDRGRP